MSKLIMFHGKECPHCQVMMPLVDKLVKEEGIKIEKKEVWHNENNADLMRSYRDIIEPKCGGQLRTPTFMNTDTNDIICGEVSYEKLKDWATR
ncbi:MAG: thioredoxin family protein [Candidatus Aminicenantes bacterium]|nr:thioredoxin family protein [Candidatus Aminicenantes bacterium]